MTGKLFGSLAGAAVAVVSLSTSAEAVSLSYDGQNNGAVGVYTTNSDDPPNRSGSAGVFTMNNNDTGGTFLAWCLDLYDYLAGGEYTQLNGPFTGTESDPTAGSNPNPYSTASGNSWQAPVLTNEQLAKIENLFEVNALTVEAIYSGVNSIQSAGFQMALWEIIYETGDSYGLTSGNFQGSPSNSTRDAVNDAADGFLANLGGTIQQNYDLTFWQHNSGTNQNLVSIAAVPVPAAGLLLLTGLAGIGFAARRRRKES
ncbi:VPLPA-CTERM sorting domain-containing protein [Marimonas arenosa]|uniref:VPLPA-CTERM sorting domain-containing protein n=1 Tax=Marimonas arenosa TaxID=1795305 RepID=A0AAE3WB02_9RHOB|nr:VPLPA-CTERM sorting domain-containing protein [Marimonas arenosa]MDQ2089651.1 VPLPA-CTERM sorting domain-containing protein [Marimonas arenosa]